MIEPTVYCTAFYIVTMTWLDYEWMTMMPPPTMTILFFTTISGATITSTCEILVSPLSLWLGPCQILFWSTKVNQWCNCPTSCYLRNSSEEIRKFWNDKAKKAAELNAMARELHKQVVKPNVEEELAEDAQNEKEFDLNSIQITWIDAEMKIEKEIGKGAYGRVFQATTRDSLTCAVKTIWREQDPVHTIRDVAKEYALQSLFCNSVYVCRAMGLATCKSVDQSISGTALLMELCKSSLNHALKELSDPNFFQRVTYAVHIATGLLCLHEQRVLHLDLKLDNILVSSTGLAVISDFGKARSADTSHQVMVCLNGCYAASYRCPEASTLDLRPCLTSESFLEP